MEHKSTRAYGRAHDEIRPIRITYDVFEYAAASVLFELGKTKVLCAITLQNNVPPFLKGKKVGWLTAEYAMLPTATHVRKERETAFKQNGRSIEISRLIGRVLRSVVSLDLLGERTIVIDCDVVQADGGTRTACISGAFIALSIAVERWLAAGKIPQNIIRDELAAISVGLKNDQLLLDLDFAEDSTIDADFNFILTRSGAVVEVQGAAEHAPIAWEQVQSMVSLAQKGIHAIFNNVHGTQKHSKQAVEPKVFNVIRMRSDVLST